jgi:uncharacterized protein (DUF2147 family)
MRAIRLAAVALLLGFGGSPVLAADLTKASPVGSWQSEDGEARVKVTMCGDGTELCAQLTGLSGKARTPENIQLLNTYVLEKAEPADANVWHGTVHFNGQTALGDITLQSYNSITLKGCNLMACKTFQFNRI